MFVRKCRNRKTGEQFAVKILSRHKFDATNEVKNLSKCQGHDAIVKLYDVLQDDLHTYIIMELLTGGELFDRLRARGKFGEREAALILKSLASAVQYMHSQGVVHRDLKPENILFAEPQPQPQPQHQQQLFNATSSRVKIVDFGFARLKQSHAQQLQQQQQQREQSLRSATTAHMQTPCFTLSYAAPEVLKQALRLPNKQTISELVVASASAAAANTNANSTNVHKIESHCHCRHSVEHKYNECLFSIWNKKESSSSSSSTSSSSSSSSSSSYSSSSSSSCSSSQAANLRMLDNLTGYDESCDFWSLGVILHTMLCGRVPFCGSSRDSLTDTNATNHIPSQEKIIERIRNASSALDFSDKSWRDISPSAKQLLCGLLNVDPKKRMKIKDLMRHEWIRTNTQQQQQQQQHPSQHASHHTTSAAGTTQPSTSTKHHANGLVKRFSCFLSFHSENKNIL